MELTVAKLLQKSSLKTCELIAGLSGINQTVRAVTVLEITDLDEIGDKLMSVNEGDLVLTAFNDIRDDVAKQAFLINRLKSCGSCGIILFYVGQVMGKIDSRIISMCDDLKMPLICPDVRKNPKMNYASVITEVMSFLVQSIPSNKPLQHAYLNELLGLVKQQLPVTAALQLLSRKFPCSLIIYNYNYSVVSKFGEHVDEIEQAFSTLADQFNFDKNTVVIEASYCQFICLNCLQEFFYIGIRPDNGEFPDRTLQAIRLMLNLIIELWLDEFSRLNERELIKALLNKQLEVAKKLASFQRIELNNVATFVIVPTNQENVIVEQFHKALVELCELFQFHFLYATHKKQKIYLFFSEYRHMVEDFLIAVEKLNRFSVPILTAQIFHAEDLFHSLSLCSTLYPKIIDLYHLKKQVTKQDVFLLSLYLGTQKTKKDLKSVPYYDMQLQLLEAYDEKNNSVITSTLVECVLYYHLNLHIAAEQKFLHYNTIKYRVRKAEELLGLKIKNPVDLTNITLICLHKLHKEFGGIQ